MKKITTLIAFLVSLPLLSMCFGLFDDNSSENKITVTPSTVTLARGTTQQFVAEPSYGTWLLEGSNGSSSINDSGLLTVGSNETASTLIVKALRYNYTDGTARVTIASPSITPSGLSVTKPEPNSIQLSWVPLQGTESYTVQRSTNGTSFGTIATVSGTSYTDTVVSVGNSYYYRINANGVNSQIVYTFADDYFNMPTFASARSMNITIGTKHYYRFPVVSGQSYVIEWHDGNFGDAGGPGNWLGGPWAVHANAWQSNGTAIFTNAYDGFSRPRQFTAASTGHVTVEVWNYRQGLTFEYQMYCYGINGADDPGTMGLPPSVPSAFRASSVSSGSISLSWDAVPDVAKYNIYRANTQNGTPSFIGTSYTTTLIDNQANDIHWYSIAGANTKDRESPRFQGAFGVAQPHFAISQFNDAILRNIASNDKHYFRLPVTAGQLYTIEWQDGNNQNIGVRYFRVAAYQNNGTTIFNRDNYYLNNGFTNPEVFTATATGFVTIVIHNDTSSSQNYQIYYF